MKIARVLYKLSAIICYIYAVLYCFTLVFLPIGFYCFIAGKRFAFKADNLFENLKIPDSVLKNYTIFVSVFCFPLGLIAIIPYFIIVSNNVKVSNLKVSTEEQKNEEPEEKEIKDVPEVKEQVVQETEEEKLEKFKKLQNFRDKGIITEEELELAKEQLFGKDKK